MKVARPPGNVRINRHPGAAKAKSASVIAPYRKASRPQRCCCHLVAPGHKLDPVNGATGLRRSSPPIRTRISPAEPPRGPGAALQRRTSEASNGVPVRPDTPLQPCDGLRVFQGVFEPHVIEFTQERQIFRDCGDARKKNRDKRDSVINAGR